MWTTGLMFIGKQLLEMGGAQPMDWARDFLEKHLSGLKNDSFILGGIFGVLVSLISLFKSRTCIRKS